MYAPVEGQPDNAVTAASYRFPRNRVAFGVLRREVVAGAVIAGVRSRQLLPGATPPPVPVPVDDAAPRISLGVTAAQLRPGREHLRVRVLDQVLGVSEIPGQQLREPDRPNACAAAGVLSGPRSPRRSPDGVAGPV